MGPDTSKPIAWPLQTSTDVPPQPWDYIHSRQSSISSQYSRASASSAQQAAESSALTRQSPTAEYRESLHPKSEPSHPVDPLARQYPKPSEDLDVREALSRKPGRWTLGHYIRETSVRNPQESHERDPEKVARDMEAKKQELLRAREEIRALSFPK